MNEKVVKLGDALMELTTAEAIELQNYLESKGLKPAQPTVISAPSTKVEEVKESTEVNVVLKDKGSLSTVKLVKPLMQLLGKNAMDTKKHLDVLPAVILEKVSRDVGKSTISDLNNEFGSEVVFELQDC